MSALKDYAKSTAIRNTPMTFEVSDKTRLERFLILGTDGGTYYATEKALTESNVAFLEHLINKDPQLVLETVVEVSTTGRAYRNSPAIFILAMMLNHAPDNWKDAVVQTVPDVARTATHVYELAEFIKNLGGWGRAKRRAIAQWFLAKTPNDLAYQAVKYRQRNGWTLKDLMRLSHPVGVNKSVGNFVLGKYTGKFSDFDPTMPEIVHGFQRMQEQVSVAGVTNTLNVYKNLPWESIPTQFLKDPQVWKTLFYNGQLKGQALVRNVTRMAKINAFDDTSFAVDYAALLADEKMIAKTKLHPVQYLNASVVYSTGQVDRNSSYGDVNRSKTWTTKPMILGAIESGFHNAFQNVIPSGKKHMIGVDVSGSMSWSAAIGSELTAAQGAAAMAMVTAKVEPDTQVFGFANTFRPLNISPDMSFAQVMSATSNMNFGSTNISLPMEHAKKVKDGSEVFIVITDNEVNRGGSPARSLKEYRRESGINAKLVVMGMTATEVTVADPQDRGMLDVSGFDANAPRVVADFAAGRI